MRLKLKYFPLANSNYGFIPLIIFNFLILNSCSVNDSIPETLMVDDCSFNLLFEDKNESIDSLLLHSELWRKEVKKLGDLELYHRIFSGRDIDLHPSKFRKLQYFRILEIKNRHKREFLFYDISTRHLSDRMIEKERKTEILGSNTKLKSFDCLAKRVSSILNDKAFGDKNYSLGLIVSTLPTFDSLYFNVPKRIEDTFVVVSKDTLPLPRELEGRELELHYIQLVYNLYYLLYWDEEKQEVNHFLSYPNNLEYPIISM